MNNPSLIINYQPLSGADAVDAWWLRFEQVGVEPDVMPVREAARLLDASFDTNPCENPDALTGGQEGAGEPAVDEEEFGALVEETIDFSLCVIDQDGNCELQLKVYRSNLNEDYRVQLTNGEILQTIRVSEQVTITETVEGNSSFTLEYPLVTQPTINWLPNLIDENGTTQAPQVEILGSTLNFGKRLTGSFVASFTTEYDLLTINVFGVDGELGECRALGFYHGAVTEHDLEMPEPDETIENPERFCGAGSVYQGEPDEVTCYKLVNMVDKCQCSGTEVDSNTVEVNVECPETIKHCPGGVTECRALVGSETQVNWIGCGEVDGDINDPEFYRQNCCDYPSFALPTCVITTTANRGGMEIENGPEHYRNLYGENVRLVPVAPDDGICGEFTVEQKLTSQNCCDGVTPIIIDTDTSVEVIPDNAAANILATGGVPPYIWSTHSEGVSLNYRGRNQVVTNIPQVTVITDEVCGSLVVSVTDGCTSAAHQFRATEGKWVSKVQVSGGGPPGGTCHITGTCSDYVGVVGSAWTYEIVEGHRKVTQKAAISSKQSQAWDNFITAKSVCETRVAGFDCDCANGDRCEMCFGSYRGDVCNYKGSYEQWPQYHPSLPETACGGGVYGYVVGGPSWYYDTEHCLHSIFYEYSEWEC